MATPQQGTPIRLFTWSFRSPSPLPWMQMLMEVWVLSAGMRGGRRTEHSLKEDPILQLFRINDRAVLERAER